LPVGTRSSKRLGYDQMLVVESGQDRVGSWQTVRVDVRAHYRAFFGRDDSASPTGIAVMTDADATASHAEAYYADFRLCRVGDASETSTPTQRAAAGQSGAIRPGLAPVGMRPEPCELGHPGQGARCF
jgi:hypothetical protein